ncbi:recombinase family protein [Pseudomonas alliivorans]|uniref:recombinase family protein n=1 Tax=Pseudomonas alliivorans TaxID=2810613 RepID=UPI001AE9E7F0|nr:recombinase family protein [Pseudomonas alliivorans]MBP0939986.1 recombinase family protein [Pseudomonas alliivorans]MEE4877378.1 recombinase family protein [Pseudomonas alliivorans]MEE4929643.1 recombinase family protein [Pseudomonas alliivorans]MEE4935058.1 recombinase family protein [Pseudomonas alliivorans]MEE4940190.1 recombinase family protein [Pseudomonas alliivorans]
MADVGYKRVSTVDQTTARQLDGMTFAQVFEDKVSGSTTQRPALQEMLRYVREGDTIHVHSIDRLACSLVDLLGLVSDLKARGVNVHFHKENLLFTNEQNANQDLMLSMMGAVVAQFERSMIKERQREGIAGAKARGTYKGGVKTTNADAIRTHVANGASYRDTAKALGVSLSTVQRAMKD